MDIPTDVRFSKELGYFNCYDVGGFKFFFFEYMAMFGNLIW